MMAIAAVAVLLAAQQGVPPPAKPQKPIGTFDDTNTGAAKPFQSVGVRGTIDAGGYAASATVKAQSEFYEQLTETQIAELRSAWTLKEPCAVANLARRTAILLIDRGDTTGAVDALEKLLRTDTDPSVLRLLGLAYEGQGQFGAAAEKFRLAASASSSDEADIFAQSAALLLAGNVDAAETLARQISEQSLDPAALTRLSLGAALFQRGEGSKALALFLDAANARPSEKAALEFAAIAVRSADASTLAHAVSVLTSVTLRSPENGTAHYALACALAASAIAAPDSTQASKIETELKKAVSLDPQIADAHLRLGTAYAAREDLPAAIAEYRFALEYNPRLVEVHYRLSQIYTRCSQPQQASSELDLHQQLRAEQKRVIESGKVPIRFPGVRSVSCP